MGLKENVEEIQKEVQEIKETSLARELLHDYKKTNQRLFTIILIVLSMWLVTIGYLIYVLNDIGIEETTTTETYDIEQDAGDNGSNSFINNSEVK